MSDGPGIPLATADAAAKFLGETWNLPPGSMWVGSLRRRLATVGDLDLSAPLPRPGDPDLLYRAIDPTLEKQGDMFQSAVNPLGRAVRGHKSHFKAADYMLRMKSGAEIKLNIWRHTRENAGWQALYRTGPRMYGIAFLMAWRDAFDLPPSQKALVEDHLRDPYGKIVPVETEADAFAKIGWPNTPPEERDAQAERLRQRMNIRSTEGAPE